MKDNRKVKRMWVRLTEDEHADLISAAKKENISAASFIRFSVKRGIKAHKTGGNVGVLPRAVSESLK